MTQPAAASDLVLPARAWIDRLYPGEVLGRRRDLLCDL